MADLHGRKRRLIVSIIALFAAELALAGPRDAVSVHSGFITTETTGVSPQSGSNVANVEFRWLRYWASDAAMYIGYKTSTSDKAGRTLYQAGLAGYRIYPFTLGLPVDRQIRFDRLEYDFFYKPYFESGMTLGRYLIDVVGNSGIYELSSETYSISLAAGCQFQFLSMLSLDFTVGYEQIFGHSSPLAFGATHAYALLGTVYNF